MSDFRSVQFTVRCVKIIKDRIEYRVYIESNRVRHTKKGVVSRVYYLNVTCGRV